MTTKSQKKENSNLEWIIVLGAIVLLALILILVKGGSKDVERQECPYRIEGNPEAGLVIKYIDSPYCVWCWLEEPILKRLVDEKGDSFKLERYDIRFCSEIRKRYGFSGTPSFVFSIENGTKEFPKVGFIGNDDFDRIICELGGAC